MIALAEQFIAFLTILSLDLTYYPLFLLQYPLSLGNGRDNTCVPLREEYSVLVLSTNSQHFDQVASHH